jgi:hypothetical protein
MSSRDGIETSAAPSTKGRKIKKARKGNNLKRCGEDMGKTSCGRCGLFIIEQK